MRSVHLDSLSQTSRTHILILIVLASLSSNSQVAHADPVCNFYVSTPADGNIPSGSTVINSVLNACFANTVIALSNNGTIQNNQNASLTSQGILTNYSSLNNDGTLSNYQGATLSNAGSLSNSNGATLINYGVVNGVALNNEGTIINNAGATISVDSSSLWTGRDNSSATLINSGTLQIAANASLSNWGILTNNSGATINGRVSNLAGGTVINHGALNANALGNTSTFINHAGATVVSGGSSYNSGTLTNDGSIHISVTGNWYNYEVFANTVGAVLISDGAFGTSGSITNDGLITNSGNMYMDSWATISGSGTISQSGPDSRLRANGVIKQSAVSVFGGSLEGTGSITAPVTVSGGKVRPGDHDIGILTIDGSLDLQNGTLVTEISGTAAGQFDILNVTGNMNLAGSTMEFSFLNNNIYKPGDSWLFLTGNTTGLSLNSIYFVFDNALGATFTTSLVNGGVKLTVLTSGTAVPIPAAGWLFGSSLFGLAGLCRKRKAA